MPKSPSNKLPAQSLARGLEILEFITFNRRSVRLKDVSEAFDLDMASAHRVLKTLEAMGYIGRLSIGRTYGPGEKLRILAKSFSATGKMVESLKPVIVELAKLTQQVAHIAILQENRAVLAEVAIAKNAKIAVQQAPGDADDLYCSAVGKALMAYLPSFEQNRLLRSIQFKAHTTYTIKTMAALKREVKEVGSKGVAFDDREGDLEIACVGAPILDKDQFPVAAIGISMLADSLIGNVRNEKNKINLVLRAARKAADIVHIADAAIV